MLFGEFFVLHNIVECFNEAPKIRYDETYNERDLHEMFLLVLRVELSFFLVGVLVHGGILVVVDADEDVLEGVLDRVLFC